MHGLEVKMGLLDALKLLVKTAQITDCGICLKVQSSSENVQVVFKVATTFGVNYLCILRVR